MRKDRLIATIFRPRTSLSRRVCIGQASTTTVAAMMSEVAKGRIM